MNCLRFYFYANNYLCIGCALLYKYMAIEILSAVK